MGVEKEIDGRQAARFVQNFFIEQYGAFGVNLFSVTGVEYDEEKKIWTVTCGFYRTLAAPNMEFYTVLVHSDGRIASVKKATT
jgi:hypothetical protein